MDLSKINREELQNIISQCEQALYNHQQWYNLIIRSLICKLPPDRHDVIDDAHKECRFGQWYYETASESLKTHLGFIALGEEHKKMHAAARKLLIATKENRTIPPFEYDSFSNALETMRLELKTLQRELSELIYNRDGLTGALNRINMFPVLREQQNMASRGIQQCTIAMLDVDNFKKINDQYGHTSGDSALASISRYILENIRAYDKLFRYGGEEFLLCFQHTDIKEAYAMSERLRQGISELTINIGDSNSITTTASIGLSSIEPHFPIEESIEQADAALYKAKADGKNCSRIWSSSE